MYVCTYIELLNMVPCTLTYCYLTWFRVRTITRGMAWLVNNGKTGPTKMVLRPIHVQTIMYVCLFTEMNSPWRVLMLVRHCLERISNIVNWKIQVILQYTVAFLEVIMLWSQRIGHVKYSHTCTHDNTHQLSSKLILFPPPPPLCPPIVHIKVCTNLGYLY